MTAPVLHLASAQAELVRADLTAALYALASDPRARQAPGRALARLRLMVESAREHIGRASAAGEMAADVHDANIRLADTAVGGLLRFARAALEGATPSTTAPVSCVAVGDYPSRASCSSMSGGLLILTGDRPQLHARGEAIAGFIAHGLDDLGIGIQTMPETVGDAARLVSLPAFSGWLRQCRLIAGQHGLFDEFLDLSGRTGELAV